MSHASISETTKQTWILISRITYELASSSTFITTLGCADDVVDGMYASSMIIHGLMGSQSLDASCAFYTGARRSNGKRMQCDVLFKHIGRFGRFTPQNRGELAVSIKHQSQALIVDHKVLAIPRPSPVMLQAVLSLSSMMAEMRTYQEHSSPSQSYDSLRSFATQLKDNFSQKPAADLQDYWDLKFLRKLMGLWRHTASDELHTLDEYISQLREQVS